MTTTPDPGSNRSKAGGTAVWDVPITIRLRARTDQAARDRIVNWLGDALLAIEAQASCESVEVFEPEYVSGHLTKGDAETHGKDTQ